MKRSKRYKSIVENIDSNQIYDLEGALSILKDNSKTKFEETVEVYANLNVKTNQRVRGIVVFPNSTGKKRVILVFAKGDKAEEAKTAGADFVGDADLIEKIKKGWYDFDVAISTPDMMKDVGKLGQQLGRRGLMPNPKIGTVTFDIKDAVVEFKKGKYEFRSEKNGVVALGIGRVKSEVKELVENAQALIEAIKKNRPVDAKGTFIKKVSVSTTMGPGLKVKLGD